MRPRFAPTSFGVVLCAAGMLLLASGCDFFSASHLWKLNRHPPLGRDDAYFSIRNDELTSTKPAETAKDGQPDAVEAF